tara:strand:- start:770 stop:985 length:216 start_codon:yes stop_codon:yes gene_type:complete
VTSSCVNCGYQTKVANFIKYFIDKNNQIVLGGSEMEGPLCQSCWYDIGDQALGFPKMLQDELKQKNVKTDT